MTENIEVLTHSSIRISSGAGTVYIDPFHIRGEPRDADFVLITHDHYDHFSPEDIQRIFSGKTTLILPEAMKKKVKELSFPVPQVFTVKPGEARTIEGLSLETVPAYNERKPFHPRGAGWVGYILSIDGQRIYIAGDTDATKEAKAVRCDVALLPVGGTYTMDARQAAELANAIAPTVAIPTHYGSIVGRMTDAETFCSLVEAPTLAEIKMQY